jgi:hypothetical protein
LLALRAKRYHPEVGVTDLREDYGPVIAEVLPWAEHHECLFHADQAVGRGLRKVYGKEYEEEWPEVAAWRQAVREMLQARTKRTAERRYEEVRGQRGALEGEEPQVGAVFDRLARPWPKWVNGIESRRAPRTNHAAERVIGKWAPYYQNFRGFESLGTAEGYLGVFEKVYRLTPFGAEAREEVRGKCPLELAGYDVSQLPWTRVCQGGPGWPPGGGSDP